MNPWLGIGSVMVVLVVFLAGLRSLQRHFAFHPELTRKMVHVGMGLVTLSFPYLFHETWPVLILALSSIVLLGSVRLYAPVQRELGSVLGGVDRASLGEIYFPVAVSTVFWMANGDKVLFLVPVLVLALADATGALIGVRYGLARYETDEGWKSWEGSLSFFIVAFLSIHIPVLLMTNTGRAESLLIGLSLALVIMLMEAISWRGLDNLFIPLTTFVLLKVYLTLSTWTLIERFAVIIVLVLAMLWWRRHTYLSRSAVIGGALVLYTSWGLGDWHWFLAPAMMLIGYTLLSPKTQAPSRSVHTIHGVFCVAFASIFWLFLSKSLDCTNLIYPYGVAYAAHLGMVALAYFTRADGTNKPRVAVIKSILLGFTIPALPYLWVWRRNGHEAILAGAAFALVALSVILFSRIQPNLDASPNDTPRWLRQGMIGLAASVLAFTFITLIEPWSKTF